MTDLQKKTKHEKDLADWIDKRLDKNLNQDFFIRPDLEKLKQKLLKKS